MSKKQSPTPNARVEAKLSFMKLLLNQLKEKEIKTKNDLEAIAYFEMMTLEIHLN